MQLCKKCNKAQMTVLICFCSEPKKLKYKEVCLLAFKVLKCDLFFFNQDSLVAVSQEL